MASAITFLTLFLIFPVVYGVNIFVGDDSGTGWNDYSDYEAWVKNKKFTTNDLLVFGYSSRHSVSEVTETDFNYCNGEHPIFFNDTSPTSFPLTTPGTRYFICSEFGHCAEGQKLMITVTDGNSPAATPPPPPSRGTTRSSPASRTTTEPTDSGTTPSPPVPSGGTVVLAGWNSLVVGVLIGVATLFVVVG